MSNGDFDNDDVIEAKSPVRKSKQDKKKKKKKKKKLKKNKRQSFIYDYDQI